jgi:hypothetical protein
MGYSGLFFVLGSLGEKKISIAYALSSFPLEFSSAVEPNNAAELNNAADTLRLHVPLP